MSFPAIPFDQSFASSLGKKLHVDGIPSLVAIDPSSGEQIESSVDFRSLIAKHGSDAFPLTPNRIKELEAEENTKIKLVIDKLSDQSIPCTVVDNATSNEIPLIDLMSHNEYVALCFGDGDFSDALYDRCVDIMNNVNNCTKANQFKMIYVGWSLYNEESDHSKVSMKFPLSISEPSDSLRDTFNVLMKGEASAPCCIVLRLGKGLCHIDGTCEDEGIEIISSGSKVLGNIVNAGAAAFPWDDAAMTNFEEQKKKRIEKLKSRLTNLDFLKAQEGEQNHIIRKDTAVDVNDMISTLGDDGVIGIYFSAHWCPPCQRFTPKLVECYEKVNEEKKRFELIFVSSDRSRNEFEEYYSTMITKKGDQFLTLDYSNREMKKDLSEIFEVSGIPTLVLLKTDGSVITKDGRECVESGASYFPWNARSG